MTPKDSLGLAARRSARTVRVLILERGREKLVKHQLLLDKRSSCKVFLLGLILVQALGCSGGSDQGDMAVTATAPVVTAESGDAWQGRYIGAVTIANVQYYGDALLTADGLMRLYLGAVGGGDGGVIEQAPPAGGSAQLVGTLQGQVNQITGQGQVLGQQCAISKPIRFCAEAGQANISMAVDSQGNIEGEISVTTSAGTETWSLSLGKWTNWYTMTTMQWGLPGQYQGLAEFSIGGDAILNVAADGSLSLQSTGSGCAGTGRGQPHLDGLVLVFDISLSISGCQPPYDYLNGAFSGLASGNPSDYWNYDSLLQIWLSQGADVSGSPQHALSLTMVPL